MYTKSLLCAAFAALLFVSCDKDEANNEKPQPTPSVPGQNNSAKVLEVKQLGMSAGEGGYANWTYVNLTTGEHETHPDFGTWTYVNTRTGETTTKAAEGSIDDVKIKWDIAFRYNLIRTNNGSARALTATELSQVKPADLEGTFTPDSIAKGRDRVMVDFSKMVQGILTYTTNDVRNPVLSSTYVRSGQMPNIVYTPKPNVVAVRTSDNRTFLLKFKDFTNNATTNGYYTFDAVKAR